MSVPKLRAFLEISTSFQEFWDDFINFELRSGDFPNDFQIFTVIVWVYQIPFFF